MRLDLTPDQRHFRDELRDYLAELMTDALRAEPASGHAGSVRKVHRP